MYSTISLASEFVEYWADNNYLLYPISFHLPYNSGEIVGRYINALDIMVILGYKNIQAAWKSIKSKLPLGDIEFSLKLNIEVEFSLDFSIETPFGDDEGIEDFLTLTQASIVIQNSPRLGSREKQRLISFLKGSVGY